ncbi:MAG: permease-like cell division protein FtsX [Flavobacteriaceae bacterium]|nr:permease-like cell division protein FtsX [Flavobacteriaceae bacterium]
MATSFEKYQKRKLRSSYFSVVNSISLILFLVGILGLLVLKTKKITDHFKEQIVVTVYFKDIAIDAEVEAFKKEVQKAVYTKSMTFISRDQAAEAFSKDIGEDFLKFLGKNPLKDAIDIVLNADYVAPEKIEIIEKQLIKNRVVEEVSYDKPLITLLTQNIQKVSFWILVASGVLTFMAVVLINNSIRLSIYSKRFTIKTMQLVGATRSFISIPFIKKSIQLGIIGAVISNIGVFIVVIYINKYLPELLLLKDYGILLTLFIGTIVLGVLISAISTFFATQRFLNLRTDELYY